MSFVNMSSGCNKNIILHNKTETVNRPSSNKIHFKKIQ